MRVVLLFFAQKGSLPLRTSDLLKKSLLVDPLFKENPSLHI